jgi:hypothetical protein
MLNSMLRQMGIFAVALLIVLAVCIGFIRFWTIWDDGLSPITVIIRSASGSPIQAVSAEAEDDPDFIRYILQQPIPLEATHHSASQSPYIGEPLTVNVPTTVTTRGALLWRYTRFHQCHKLVFIAEYKDGRRKGRVVDIPDLHKSRTVAVEVP